MARCWVSFSLDFSFTECRDEPPSGRRSSARGQFSARLPSGGLGSSGTTCLGVCSLCSWRRSCNGPSSAPGARRGAPRKQEWPPGLRAGARSDVLFEVEVLESAGAVQDGAPNLVGRLVLGESETERDTQAEFESVDVFQRVDQTIGGDVSARALQAFEQQVAGDIALERDEVGLFLGSETGQSFAVLETHRGLTGWKWHHLRDDDALGVLWPELHELLGQRLAPDEGDVSENHVRSLLADFLDEARCRPVSGDHHHCGDIGFAVEDARHRLGHVGGVSRVGHLENRARRPLQLPNDPGDPLETGVAIAVILRENSNLLGLDVTDLDEVADNGRSLLAVTGSVVENVAVRW